jgi:ADP-ribosyl-[dinitrogen reductase] hydrolase
LYENMSEKLNKCKGALLGLAIGDALGTTLEFRSPGTFTPLTDLVGGGPFGLTVGKWTDDTSMALCMADSIIEKQKFDAFDQIEKYLSWYKHGYNSSTGDCFDIGNATRHALNKFENTGQAFCGDESRYSAGNGSIMRLAPIPIVYYNDVKQLNFNSALSSKTTHASPQCIDACVYMSNIIAAFIQGKSKDEVLSDTFSLIPNYWLENPLDPTIDEILKGSFKTKEPPQICGSGYVVKTLEAALWAFYHTDNFEVGALKVVNLGDDADTTGAVYGQIAGAYYGLSGIPDKWLEKLYWRKDIEVKVEKLFEISEKNEK